MKTPNSTGHLEANVLARFSMKLAHAYEVKVLLTRGGELGKEKPNVEPPMFFYVPSFRWMSLPSHTPY